MSGRTTAEIVTRLYNNTVHYGPDTEAADRLAELDAKVAAVNTALDRYERDIKRPDSLYEVTVNLQFRHDVAEAVGR